MGKRFETSYTSTPENGPTTVLAPAITFIEDAILRRLDIDKGHVGVFPLAKKAIFDVCQHVQSDDLKAEIYPDTSDQLVRFYFIGKSFCEFIDCDLFSKPFFQKSMIESYSEKFTERLRSLTLEYPWGEVFITAEAWTGPSTREENFAFSTLISTDNPPSKASLAYFVQMSLDQHGMSGFWEDEQCDRVPEAFLGRTPLADLVELAAANPSILFASEGRNTFLKPSNHIKGLDEISRNVFLSSSDYYKNNQDLVPQSALYLCKYSQYVDRVLEMRDNIDADFEFSLPYLLEFMPLIGNDFFRSPVRIDDFSLYALEGSIQMPEPLATPRSWKYT